MSDATRPDHYKMKGGRETFDHLDDLGICEPFCAGNVIKYVSRYRTKNGVEDLRKAAVYLRKLIQLEEAKTK